MKTTGRHAKLAVSSDGAGIVGQAGGVLLTETLRATGLDQALSEGLGRWRRPRATHDPGKVVADLAVMSALGGDCLSDISILRAEPELFGPVPSDPTVSRLVTALAQDGPKALRAIRKARASARARAWGLAGGHAPGAGGGVIPVDLDATIVRAYSERSMRPRRGSAPSGPPDDRVHRPRPRRDRGGRRPGPAAGQRRLQHRRRPHRATVGHHG